MVPAEYRRRRVDRQSEYFGSRSRTNGGVGWEKAFPSSMAWGRLRGHDKIGHPVGCLWKHKGLGSFGDYSWSLPQCCARAPQRSFENRNDELRLPECTDRRENVTALFRTPIRVCGTKVELQHGKSAHHHLYGCHYTHHLRYPQSRAYRQPKWKTQRLLTSLSPVSSASSALFEHAANN